MDQLAPVEVTDKLDVETLNQKLDEIVSQLNDQSFAVWYWHHSDELQFLKTKETGE